MATSVVRTFGDIILEARTLLQDKIPTSGSKLRYSDSEMFEAINRMVTSVRALRPDLVLGVWGPRSLRNILPYYNAANDMATPFPFDLIIYPSFVQYLVGFAEMREDTFSESGRASQMLQMAAGNLMGAGGMAQPQGGGR